MLLWITNNKKLRSFFAVIIALVIISNIFVHEAHVNNLDPLNKNHCYSLTGSFISTANASLHYKLEKRSSKPDVLNYSFLLIHEVNQSCIKSIKEKLDRQLSYHQRLYPFLSAQFSTGT